MNSSKAEQVELCGRLKLKIPVTKHAHEYESPGSSEEHPSQRTLI